MKRKALIVMAALLFLAAIVSASRTGGAHALENRDDGTTQTCGVYASDGDTDEGDTAAVDTDTLADELDLGALGDYFSTLTEDERALFGFDLVAFIKRAAAGETDFGYSTFAGYLLGALGTGVLEVLPTVSSILAIAILLSVAGAVRGGGSGSDGVINLIGMAVVAALILSTALGVIRRTSALVTALGTQMEAVFPVLFTLMSALGASSSIAIYRPAVAVLAFSLTELLSAVTLPLVIVTLVFSIIGHLSDGIKLGGMAKFFASIAKWTMYTSFFLFLAFLSVQGITAAVYDSVSIRSAKFALSKYVPVIGGYLSDGFNVVLAGTVLLKNAVGLTAVLLLLVGVVPVLMQVVAASLAFKLAGALSEPFGCGNVAGALSSAASALDLLISVILGIAFLYFIFLMLLVLSGNAVL